MTIPTRAMFIPLMGADSAAGDSSPADFCTWRHIGRVAEVAVWDAANRAKDRQDEALDAMRVSGGMTLDEYLASK